MLKKLKLKFVLTIMTIVTVLFGAAFGLVLCRTGESLERESVRMMQPLADGPPQPGPVRMPGDPSGRVGLPFFTVVIKPDGEIDAFGDGSYDLTDGELLRALVNEAAAEPGRSGVLTGYDLRYLKAERGEMRRVVFADISGERAMLGALARNFLLIGLAGFALFLAVSLFLADWVTRPVEKAWEEQKQFVADASHELKTPLTVIITGAGLLEDGVCGEAGRKSCVRNIAVMAERMRRLAESLLELARADSGAARGTVRTVDFGKLVSDAALPFEPLFYEENRRILCDAEDRVTVRGNPEQLAQVVNILLDNALKYADSDVGVVLRRRRGRCVLSVAGRGDPISDADRVNIFKRFYRIERTGGGHGYGLGLSIAERIVREHGGRIWVRSEGGENVFYVSLECSAEAEKKERGRFRWRR